MTIKRQLPYIPVIILLTLNAAPRRMVSSGTQHWFALSVPEPERFASSMHRAHDAVRTFGYPFVCYFKHGWVFTTKEGNKLFLPSEDQRPLRERFSSLALTGNLAMAFGSGLLLKLLLIVIERHCAPPSDRNDNP